MRMKSILIKTNYDLFLVPKYPINNMISYDSIPGRGRKIEVNFSPESRDNNPIRSPHEISDTNPSNLIISRFAHFEQPFSLQNTKQPILHPGAARALLPGRGEGGGGPTIVNIFNIQILYQSI